MVHRPGPRPVRADVGGAILGRSIGRLALSTDRTGAQRCESRGRVSGRSAKERKALAQAMFAHGGLLLELVRTGRASRCSPAAKSRGGALRQAQMQGKGVLFFTGHFGYWEMNAMSHALRVEPISVLARPS
jgi:lauroyl/myristoyl acyltransferase